MKPRNTVSESGQHPPELESEARAKPGGMSDGDVGGAGRDGAFESGGLPAPGTIIGGRYRVERELGSGGMGVVVAARHLELGHRVAIKLLSLADAGATKRFVREARICAGLSSEHIVRVFDNGQLPTGTPYMVMEYLHGQDLREFMAGTGVSIADAILIVRQLCAALAEAHAAGIVHRDLKPSNLFRVERSDGSALIKVLDFGISKVREGPTGQTGSKLTQPGGFIGTQHYASPEQLTSSPAVDHRADIWAAGTILYELLTGTLAFPQEHFLACWVAISEARFVPPRRLRPEIPAGLEAIVQRCLRVDPGERFASSEELADVLDAQLAEFEPGNSAFDARAWPTTAARSQSRAQAPIGLSGMPNRDPGPRRSKPFAALSAAVARSYQALRLHRAPRTSPLRGSMTPIALAAAVGLAASGLVWGKLLDRFAGPATASSGDTTTAVHAVSASPEPAALAEPSAQPATPASAAAAEASRAEAEPPTRSGKPSRRRSARGIGHTEPAASAAPAVEATDSIDSPPPAVTFGDEDRVDPSPVGTSARSELPALRPRARVAPSSSATDQGSSGAPFSATDTGSSSPPQPAAVYQTSFAPAPTGPGYVVLPRRPVVIEQRTVAPGIHLHVRAPGAGDYVAPARKRRSFHEALRSLHEDSGSQRRRHRSH